MKKTCLFRNDHVRAETMSGIGLIRVTWTDHPDSREFHTTFRALLEEIREGGYHLLLLDERCLDHGSLASCTWYNEEVLPAMNVAGVERIGVIGHSDSPLSHGAWTANGSEGTNVAFFDNVAMAMLWLLGNGRTDLWAFNEAKRLDTLRSYHVLDTENQASYDDITRIAAYITGAPISVISLVDSERQWFKSSIGLAVSETPRELSFCSHAIENPKKMLVVKDATQDPRFSKNPLVTDSPNIRFYAGAPLVGTDGYAVGTLCVIDRKPRELNQSQLDSLSALARLVVMQLEYRRIAYDMKEMHNDMEEHLAQFSTSTSKLGNTLDRQVNYLLDSYPKSDLDHILLN